MSRILIQDENKTVLLEELILAETPTARMRGLLGRSELPKKTGMLIRPCRSIHMWFMRFPIDAAFLDKELCVLKISRNLRPWQLAFAPRKTHCVLETAEGTFQELKTGMQLSVDAMPSSHFRPNGFPCAKR
jgi:uncharacterized membrane protein (UPF0127 family)